MKEIEELIDFPTGDNVKAELGRSPLIGEASP
jgi:hypothetical protein